MKRTRPPNRVADVASRVENCLRKEALDAEWKTANEFYFKSLAAVQLLLQIRLKHHQDFTSEQYFLFTWMIKWMEKHWLGVMFVLCNLVTLSSKTWIFLQILFILPQCLTS